MRSFKHMDPDSIDAAVSILDKYKEKARVVGGGTDLLGTLKDNIHSVYPEVLVNAKTIPGLRYIRQEKERLRIGALTKISEIEKNDIVKEKHRILSEAARSVASPQIRNMATIGGNICQEPRCWYYRNPENSFHCTRKGGTYCNALTGENRYHSIFGSIRVDIPPCSSNCPGQVDIPTHIDRIREGDLSGAASVLLKTNPIPALTGRVCPHFCEEECNRGVFDEAVSIRSIERCIGDYILDHADKLITPPEMETGRSAAIVGAGPAGLAAAFYLRMQGHHVVVFDQMPEAGGMLAYGIPTYRLPKTIVRRQIQAFEKAGIQFRLKTTVGRDVSLDDIKDRFDVLFLANGAWGRPSIGLEGEEYTTNGLQFLTDVHCGTQEAPGKRVVVIGGGNVAVDAARIAKRMGAEEVNLAFLEKRDEMPAFESEVARAEKEGIRLMQSWGPSKVVESNGEVKGIELIRCTSVFDDQGRFSPTYDYDEIETISTDGIIIAAGQKSDLSFVSQEWPIKNDLDLITVNRYTQETTMPAVFAGGDVTTGPTTVVQAIGAGRRAATAMDRNLRKREKNSENGRRKHTQRLLQFNHEYLNKTPRVKIQPGDPERGGILSLEDSPSLGKKDMETEANRCFNCGCVAVSPSDIAPVLIVLDAMIKTTKRRVMAEEFFTANRMSSTILDPDEMVVEIQIPDQKPGNYTNYNKFGIRQSIDFPVVNVAVALALDSGRIQNARIALGAVAPIPLRVKKAEAFLQGKEVVKRVAGEAASIAVENSLQLGKNEYKIQITEALIKRAILGAK